MAHNWFIIIIVIIYLNEICRCNLSVAVTRVSGVIHNYSFWSTQARQQKCQRTVVFARRTQWYSG